MTNQTKSLFQYRPPKAWAYENLCSYNIYFSPPARFNDPFDYRAPPKLKLQDLKPGQLDVLREASPRLWGASVARLPDDKFIARVNRRLEWRHERITQTCGVACFSKRNDSLLMWSHYAGGSRGFCLEFDGDNEDLYETHDVDYSENFPLAYDYAEVLAKDYGKEKYKEKYASLLLKHKNEVWEYEKEVRMFRGRFGNVSYHPQSLKAIYLGTATTDETQQLIQAIAKEKYPHAKVIESNPHQR